MTQQPAIPTARGRLNGYRPARRASRIVLLIVVFFALWSNFVKLDVVAVATGFVVLDTPSNSVKLGMSGVLQDIHVTDGQVVTDGQLLLELDQTELLARLDQFKRLERFHLSEMERFSILLSNDAERRLSLPPDLDEQEQAFQVELLESAQSHFESIVAAGESQVTELMDRIEVLRRQRALQMAKLNALEAELEIKEALEVRGVLANLELVDLQREREEAEILVTIAEAEIAAADRSVMAVQRTTEQVLASLRLDWNTSISEATTSLDAVRAEIIALERQLSLTQLRAPHSGEVQDLVVFSAGEPMSYGDVLLRIVPQNATMEVEAYILNKDIGFVQVGQEVSVKLEAFPFTKYGALSGVVTFVSQDVSLRSVGPAPLTNFSTDVDERSASALQESYQQASVYLARIELGEQTVHVNGRDEALRPGMTATVDIITNQRTLVEFFTAPISRYFQTALRER